MTSTRSLGSLLGRLASREISVDAAKPGYDVSDPPGLRRPVALYRDTRTCAQMAGTVDPRQPTLEEQGKSCGLRPWLRQSPGFAYTVDA